MKRTWITPGGEYSPLCFDMLQQSHLLIAGSTGSGKSVLVNSLIWHVLYKAPCQAQLILIDPKRVELYRYRKLPHTLSYASEPPEIVYALQAALAVMESRYRTMQHTGETETQEGHIYVIIDEYADLITTQKRETQPLLCRLAQLGRAAHVHLIVATQRPTRDIVNGQIKVNMDARVALRCPSPQDSRNIIDRPGAEKLPRYGYGYYYTPDGLQLVQIPYTTPEEIAARIKWWTDQHPRFRLFG